MRHADPYYACMVSSSTQGWRLALVLAVVAVAAFCRTIWEGLA